MIATICAFVLGMREFRLTCTTHIADDDLMEAYGLGREWAHRLTLRYFEPF